MPAGHFAAAYACDGQVKIDCIESISPPPTGNIEIWDARAKLPEHIALIGGIEAVNFLNLPLEA